MPIRPVLNKKESISGYFYRVLKSNYFSSASSMISKLDITSSQAQNNFIPLLARTRLAHMVIQDDHALREKTLLSQQAKK
ncbi:hypothetical protein [Paenibacillus sp. NFR01]|uniref:hypothetical protein n=1 Tax=Paenibacillus sp. NFR01 TaxID=1566279 RepID=UPI001113C57C|nr:hypothetical protein [Paenibacillus sp. NFR01]